MAEMQRAMKQLQELLQDADLRRQIQGAPDEVAVSSLLNIAGEPKGYRFDARWVRETFDDVRIARKPPALTEEELLHLASTYPGLWSAPKLCHTESCGGHPDACC